MNDDVNSEEENEEKETQNESKAVRKQITDMIKRPSVVIEFLGMRDLQKPLSFELTLLNSYLNIDRDQLLGSLRIKDIAQDI